LCVVRLALDYPIYEILALRKGFCEQLKTSETTPRLWQGVSSHKIH
jgi:hypothetical protein